MIRRILLFAFLCFWFYLLWPYGVFRLRHVNPHTTALMELRQDEARRLGRPLKPKMTWEDLGSISPNLVHAIILSEDDTFYQHHGFDLEQIQIAIARDLEKHKYAYGGSTITQQLARSLYLRPRKSILRKVKEAVLTVYLEMFLPKKRILELYLNVIEWGTGIFGAEAASEAYFNKSAADLTPDEAVALTSILPSPRRWSPVSEKAFMARRRTQLLERMARAGYLPPPAYFLDGDSTAIQAEPNIVPVDPNTVPVDPNAIYEPPHPVAPPEEEVPPVPLTLEPAASDAPLADTSTLPSQ